MVGNIAHPEIVVVEYLECVSLSGECVHIHLQQGTTELAN